MQIKIRCFEEEAEMSLIAAVAPLFKTGDTIQKRFTSDIGNAKM